MKEQTIQRLKDTIKQWVKDYNMLDSIIEIKDAMLDDYKDINKSLTQTVLNYITKLEQIKVENEALITKNHKLKEILQEIKGTCIYYREQMGIKKGSVTDFLAGEILDSIDKMEV